MEKYRIITHFTLLVDDYSPLRGPPDPSGWCPHPPGEVPQTPQNDFRLGKSLRPLGMSFPLGSPPDLSEWFSPCEVLQMHQNDFTTGKSPRTLRIKKVMPLSSTTPHPLPPPIHEHFSILCIPAYMTFFSFFFKLSRDLFQTAGGSAGLWLRSRDQGFPPATTNVAPGYFHGKITEKYNQKKFLAVWFPFYWLYLPSNLVTAALFRNHFLY